MEGATLPEAVRMLTRKAYQDGRRDAEKDDYAYIVLALLMKLQEELERHPYQAPGMHVAIDMISNMSHMTKDEWREYLDEDLFELKYTMSWEHPGIVRWDPPE